MNNVNHLHPSAGPWFVTLVTIAVFVIIDQTNVPLYQWLRGDSEGTVRFAIFAITIYGSMTLGPIVVAAWLFGPRRILQSLGLDKNPLPALGFSLAITSVMLIYFAATSPLATLDSPLYALIRSSVLPGIGEEVFYRAFLFGFLFRFARWGFLPASLLVAGIFGVAHLYQGSSAQEAAGIFAITAAGAIWFSWLYVEWRFNLWVPAFFHLFMNAWWEIFAVSDSALGPMGANLIRLLVIVLSIVLTISIANRLGRQRLISGRSWLWGGPRKAEHG